MGADGRNEASIFFPTLPHGNAGTIWLIEAGTAKPTMQNFD